MAISKITGLELPEMAAGRVEMYVKCPGRGLPAIPGTDRDGIKGKCPECTAEILLRETAEGDVVLSSHLAGGKTPPVAAGTKGVRTAEPARPYGQNVTYRGNTPADVVDLPPLVRGADMPAVQPRPKMHDGREVPSNGTMAGGIGRPHIVMAPGTDLVSGHSWDRSGRKVYDTRGVPGMRGESDPRVTRAEYDAMPRKARQRYVKKISDMRAAALAARARRREFEREYGTEPACGTGPTAARHFDSMPVGTRTGQSWDASKGGRFVDTVSRRKGERSPLRGVRIDAKPFGVKHEIQAWEDKGR